MNDIKQKVEDYYSLNAKNYIEDTLKADMKIQYGLFEKYLNKNDKILDIGFGSGRDIKYFSQNYNVYGIDITNEFVLNAKQNGLNNVFLQDAENFTFDFLFDGIWACASLLHIEKNKLKQAFLNIKNHLKIGGVFYLSFKYGTFEGEKNGRYFVFMNEEMLEDLIRPLGFEILEKVLTNDVRPNRDDKWINVVLKKI